MKDKLIMMGLKKKKTDLRGGCLFYQLVSMLFCQYVWCIVLDRDVAQSAVYFIQPVHECYFVLSKQPCVAQGLVQQLSLPAAAFLQLDVATLSAVQFSLDEFFIIHTAD